MAFGIQDLERDVQKFQQDIENAKAKYLAEYAEYVNITTDLENVAQKYDFLQEEVEPFAEVFPEERGNTLSGVTIGFLSSAIPVNVIAGISYAVREFNAYKLAQVGIVKSEIRALAKAGSRNAMVVNSNIAAINNIDEAVKSANKFVKATNIAKFTAGVGAILSIVGIALTIRDITQRKKYLEEQKAALKQNLDDVNGYIAETNDATKDIIAAFSGYFDEFEIDVDGVFNENQDGFLNQSGQQKFGDAVSQLRETLNGAVKRVGELNASIKLANRFIDRNISKGLAGAELIEEVIFATELPEELIQRLYVFKLQELGSTVKETIELSQLPEELVKELYARGYLDDGKTIEETIELSGLTEDQVRRVYASKLLDDQLNAENPDDVLGIKGIAKQTGLTEEIVLEIQLGKIADLPRDSESEELEQELVTR